jgi:hypothetical protein
MLNEPLEDAAPYPDIIEKDPPVESADCPALIVIRPPSPKDGVGDGPEAFPPAPSPTMMLILPPTPETALPVLSMMWPLLPLEADPVEKDKEPLVPFAAVHDPAGWPPAVDSQRACVSRYAVPAAFIAMLQDPTEGALLILKAPLDAMRP